MRAPQVILLCLSLSSLSWPQDAPAPFWGSDLEGLRKAVANDPGSAGLRLRLVRVLLEEGQNALHPNERRQRSSEAESHFQKILELNPRAAAPLGFMALRCYREGQLERAVELGRAALEVLPTDSEVAVHVLKALVRLERLEEAATFCVSWLRSGATPSFGSLQGLLSTLLLDPAFRDRLGPLLEAACEEKPGDVFLLLYRSLFLAEVGRSESAWELLHAAERKGLCDHNTGSRHLFVRSLQSRAPEVGQTPADYDGLNLEELGRRLEQSPGHAGLKMRQARLLDLGGRTEAALAAYAAVRDLNPEYWPAIYRAGEILLSLDRAEEAAPLLRAASRLFPAFAPGVLAEAAAWSRTTRSDEAVPLLLETVRHYEPGEAWNKVLGRLGSGAGSPLESLRRDLAEAVEADPQNAGLRAGLALVYLRSSDAEAARAQALAAERAGLAGREGRPASVLYQAYGVEEPPAAAGEPTSPRR